MHNLKARSDMNSILIKTVIILLLLLPVTACNHNRKIVWGEMAYSYPSHFVISNYCTFPVQYTFDMNEADKVQASSTLPKFLLLEELKLYEHNHGCGNRSLKTDTKKIGEDDFSLPVNFSLKDVKKRVLVQNAGDAFALTADKFDESVVDPDRLAEFVDRPFHLYPSTKITIWAKGKLFMTLDRDKLRSQEQLDGNRFIVIRLCSENRKPCPATY